MQVWDHRVVMVWWWMHMDRAPRSEPVAVLHASRSQADEKEAAAWKAGGGTGRVESWRLRVRYWGAE